MSTISQLIKKPRKFAYEKKGLLYYKPQQRGICMKSFIRSPKKPNSAKRKVVNVSFIRKKGVITVRNQTVRKFKVQCYLPGIASKVQQHASILFRGGRLQDVPGVRFHLICGVLDLKCVLTRKKARSKYGTKKNLDI